MDLNDEAIERISFIRKGTIVVCKILTDIPVAGSDDHWELSFSHEADHEVNAAAITRMLQSGLSGLAKRIREKAYKAGRARKPGKAFNSFTNVMSDTDWIGWHRDGC